MKGIVIISYLIIVINIMLVARDIVTKRASKRILLQAFVISTLFWVCVISHTYYLLKIGGIM